MCTTTREKQKQITHLNQWHSSVVKRQTEYQYRVVLVTINSTFEHFILVNLLYEKDVSLANKLHMYAENAFVE